MSFGARLAALYFHRLNAYAKRDSAIQERMLAAFAQNRHLLKDGPLANEALRVLSEYRTRLYQAATVQTLTIWGAVRGSKEAVSGPEATGLALTLRMAFGLSDIMDTASDDFDPRVRDLAGNLPGSAQDSGAFERFSAATAFLNELIDQRFDRLHPGVKGVYEGYKRRLLEGQAEDVDFHLGLLRGDLAGIRTRLIRPEDVMELLVRKLGLMGEGAAHIAYRETGAGQDEVEEEVAQFYRNAGVLIQFWANDVHKIWQDARNRETNPVVLAALVIDPTLSDVGVSSLRSFLRAKPTIFDELSEPFHRRMMSNYAQLKRFGFDPRSHRGIVLGVDRWAAKERKSLREGGGA